MSEIFAPGSVAGPAGSVGAAGSASAISALIGSIGLTSTNIFNYSAAQANYITNSDGTLGYHAPGTIGGGPPIATPLMYCPGAVGLICNSTIATAGFGSGAYIQLFDANGNFTGNATDPGGYQLAYNTVLTLPGTQTYVRLTIGGGFATVLGIPETMICAGASPTMPSSFQPFGLDTIADVNAKDAVVAANAATALLSGLTTVPGLLMATVLPGGITGTRNAYNYKNVLAGHDVASDGSTPVGGGDHTVATIYCPNATHFISNLPFEANGAHRVCTYDTYGNFIADITGTITTSSGGNFQAIGVVQPLPGTQTYVKISYAAANVNGGGELTGDASQMAHSVESAVFYAGTTASPVPTTLTALNSSVPYQGNAVSANSKTASALGAVTDGMDPTAIFNAFLATASSTNPVELVLDGMYPTTGLVISPNGYTMIRGLGAGTGLSLTSTVQDIIRIGTYPGPTANSEGAHGTPPARTAINIALRDFQIVPNSQTNASANQPASGDAAHGTYGIILTSCANVLIDGLNVLANCANYCVCLSNVENVAITKSNFVTGGTLHDGVQIDGPSENIRIDGCKFATGDDGIALNAYEGYGGDISNVTITNCVFISAATLLRAYGSASGDSTTMVKVRGVTVSNCTGSVLSCVASLGLTAGGCNNSNLDEIEDMTFSNCDLTHGQVGSIYNAFLLACNVRLLRINNHIHHPLTAIPFVQIFGYSTGHVVIDGLTIVRGDEASAACTIAQTNATASGTCSKLTLRGITVTDKSGSSYSALPNVVGASTALGTLVLDGVDMDKFSALFDGSGTANITTIRGAGVLGTGTSVPDSVMDNNVLYLSSTASGAPSIKVAGTAKRLTLA